MTQECVIMNMSVTYCYAATRVHEAAMSLIRYWFVRSSLQVEVQETFKKDHFIYKIILIPQEYIHFGNILNSFTTICCLPIALFSSSK